MLDSIFLTEISLDGSITSRVPLLPNTLAIEEKVREPFITIKVAIFWVCMERGVYEFDRNGNQINFIKTPPLTHDIYVDE